MASLTRRISVFVSAEAAWDAVRDIGALHSRLEPGAGVVTFANDVTIREPIVACDEAARRLVWTAQGGRTAHYNASLQVFAAGEGAELVWIADFLPDEAAEAISAAMDAGAAAMRATLNTT